MNKGQRLPTRAHLFDRVLELGQQIGKTVARAVALRFLKTWVRTTWQRNDRTFWRGKNADTFKPMGPWIETDLKLDDNLITTVNVNGRESLRYHTNHMLFGVVRFLVAMTKYLTVYPGDVMWMGTDGTSPNLVHGDVVDVSITGIGTLTNKFVREGM